MGRVLGRIDAALGSLLERGVVAHHTRRLRRLGSERALAPGESRHGGVWADGDPPPRPGNAVEVLVDGAEALRSVAASIAAAERSVMVCGWHLEAAFELIRGEDGVALGALLAEAAERVDVRVLQWAGAPVPLFHPTRREVQDAVATLTRGTRIRCETDPREHPVHCHHEKLVIVDDAVAHVGGIDLTDFGGDRYDTPGHPARRRLGWHDVATRIEGPVVADVAAHAAMRWEAVTGERLPAPPRPRPAGDTTVQFVRTVAEDMYDAVPRGDFRILESYIRALRSARELVYLENQFLWSPEVVGVLAEALRDPPTDDFRVVVLLPAKANNGHDDTRGQVAVLTDADGDGDRFLAATLRSRSGARTDRLYVHAKVGIVDDRWLTVGSANLNAHSLLNDTEANIVTDDAQLAHDTRVRLWAEHLEVPEDAVRDRPAAAVVDELWRPIAFEQLARSRDGRPATHRLLALPGVNRRTRRLLGPLQGLIDDG